MLSPISGFQVAKLEGLDVHADKDLLEAMLKNMPQDEDWDVSIHQKKLSKTWERKSTCTSPLTCASEDDHH